MFLSFIRPHTRTFAAPLSAEALASPAPRLAAFLSPQPHARAEHARLLTIAAARRCRAMDRLREARADDAEYWIACAPTPIAKAAALRTGFNPLP
jgi:hypothetical protein